jgi:hypothetical protein
MIAPKLCRKTTFHAKNLDEIQLHKTRRNQKQSSAFIAGL